METNTSERNLTTSTGTVAAEVEERILGPYVTLSLYFRNYRHWCAPQPDGTPRPVERQFLELEREGIACLYDALNALVEEQYPHGSEMRRPTTAPNLGRWGDMSRERGEVKRAWSANNGNDPQRTGTPYGAIYTRAHHQLVHEVRVVHVVTEEEAARDNARQEDMPPEWRGIIRPGDVYFPPDPALSTTATAEQIGRRVAQLFDGEVQYLLGYEPDDQTLAAFARLYSNLKGYTFGAKEGAVVLERMKAEGKGAEVLAAFKRIRDHLNALLDEIAEVHLSQPDLNPNRITWKGTKGELAELIVTLEDAGWIDKGQSWPKLAARVHATFQDREGEPFDLATLKQYIKPSGNRSLRDGVLFEATSCPE